MPHTRPTKTMMGAVGAAGLLLVVACGDEPVARGAAEIEASPSPSTVAAAAAGDPLLQRAREGIRDGLLPAPLEAEVLDSSAPAHARARRVLLAMADPSGGIETQDELAPGEAAPDARLQPPPILPPADIETASDTAVVPTKTGGAAKTKTKPLAATPSRGRADLGALALRSTKRGATLTIAAPSSLVVGVANQPASGLVRLVIESARANAGVLGARPKTDGAAVTGVRQGQGTVQITVQLEPGWTLGSVQPFAGGAKVHLVAPL